ncbi:ExbD/TolR family protein [Stenomitos frigidus]|uniref:Biopolymer transporter ExbD n=1 Tax=Stenomitos frigidus ULC18 TaxID=2107698 RepID=A0A2T1DY07_9CYAN|nr:biopolymer transporter ExbD [Stenomitos frigidus]PSB25264.1 biopolymer transporter ExbD [Stenomitos frigidus ULC18]
MKINLDTPTEEVQIQIIPLIDVIFCILTFFILAALQLTRQQGIEIDLPKASTGATQMRQMLVVTVSATGQTFVNKQFADRAQLYQQLQDYHQKNPDGLLVLNASQTAFYNDVVQVLDVMRQVGGDRVALATQPAETSQPSGVIPAPTVSPTITNPTTDPFNIFATPSSGQPANSLPFQNPPASGQPSNVAPSGAPAPRTNP